MYRIRTVFTGPQGTPWLSTAFFDEGGGSAQQAANAVGAFWGACDALMGTAVLWSTESDVAIIDEFDGTLTAVGATTPVTGAGALSTELAPIASQALMRWRTNGVNHGRSVRGRTFIPGLTVSSQDDGRVIAASQTVFNTAAAALIADTNSIFVIWHRPRDEAPTVGAAFAVITGTCWPSFAVMRSRRD